MILKRDNDSLEPFAIGWINGEDLIDCDGRVDVELKETENGITVGRITRKSYTKLLDINGNRLSLSLSFYPLSRATQSKSANLNIPHKRRTTADRPNFTYASFARGCIGLWVCDM